MPDNLPTQIDTGKTYLVKGSTLALLVKLASEWQSLEVTPPANGKLTRGTKRTILELLASGGGLPPGYTWVEFTGCGGGTPVTYWQPTWPTNPEAPPS